MRFVREHHQVGERRCDAHSTVSLLPCDGHHRRVGCCMAAATVHVVIAVVLARRTERGPGSVHALRISSAASRTARASAWGWRPSRSTRADAAHEAGDHPAAQATSSIAISSRCARVFAQRQPVAEDRDLRARRAPHEAWPPSRWGSHRAVAGSGGARLRKADPAPAPPHTPAGRGYWL